MALAAEQGKELNEMLGSLESVGVLDKATSKVIEVDGTVSSTSSSSAYVCTYPYSGGVAYASGRVGTASGYCMVAYYGDEDTFLGYELPYGEDANNITNYKLTVPSGTVLIKVSGNDSIGGPAELNV